MRISCLHLNKPFRWLSPVGILLTSCVVPIVFSQELPPAISISSVTSEPLSQANAASFHTNASPDPIELFRQLLASNAEERQKSLAAKPDLKRKYLEEKLLEYDHLSAREKESRLKMLQLRYHLEPLMRLPAESRATRLAEIPANYSKLVQERLAEWDLLPPALQEEVLNTEIARGYFMRVQNNGAMDNDDTWILFPPEKRQELEEEITKLQLTPPEQRKQLFDRFDRFFEFSEGEKRKTMDSLPEPERRQALEAIDVVEKYPVQQRKKFITAFQKVAGMSPAERQKFLKNAERWQAMSIEERRAWRDLVATLPPLPPGMPIPAIDSKQGN